MQDSFVEDIVALLPNLKRFALSLCRRPEVADDLVQITAERGISIATLSSGRLRPFFWPEPARRRNRCRRV